MLLTSDDNIFEPTRNSAESILSDDALVTSMQPHNPIRIKLHELVHASNLLELWIRMERKGQRINVWLQRLLESYAGSDEKYLATCFR